MKNRWESPETFGKYAELEAIDYMIRQENERLKRLAPASPIDAMIDQACGFGTAQQLESIDRVKELLSQQIECEKFLDIDSSYATEFLAELNTLEEKLKADFTSIA